MACDRVCNHRSVMRNDFDVKDLELTLCIGLLDCVDIFFGAITTALILARANNR